MNTEESITSFGFIPIPLEKLEFEGELYLHWRGRSTYREVNIAEEKVSHLRNNIPASVAIFYVGARDIRIDGYSIFCIDSNNEFIIISNSISGRISPTSYEGEETLGTEAMHIAKKIYMLEKFHVYFIDSTTLRCRFINKISPESAKVVEKLVLDQYPYIIATVIDDFSSLHNYITLKNEFFLTILS